MFLINGLEQDTLRGEAIRATQFGDGCFTTAAYSRRLACVCSEAHLASFTDKPAKHY